MALALRYSARSDRGLVRANNEDSVYAGPRLLALADGMGGHAAGEVASQLVIAALAPLDDDEPNGDLLHALGLAIHEGNSAIADQVEADPDLDGMGTTLTAILFAGTRLGLAHVGDSRGYLLRGGEFTQITKDDTFVQTLVDDGRITAEEAHSHPQRSLIMRALTGHEVQPTLTVREARVGDRYLLCSDGLSDPVSRETIAEALRIPDVADAAMRLIELALRGGGPDNVTVVVADIVEDDFGQTQPILAGAVSTADREVARPDTAAGRASALRPRAEAPRAVATVPETPPPKARTRRRILLALAVAALLIVATLGVGRWLIRDNYYVGAHDGTVSIMRGVSGSIAGYPLQEPYSFGCLDARDSLSINNYDDGGASECARLTLDDLNPPERAQVQDGLPTGSLDEAIRQMNGLANDALLPRCPGPTTANAPSASPSPSASPFPSAAPTPGSVTPKASAPAPSATAGAASTPVGPAPGPTPLPDPTAEPGTDCRAAA